LLHIRPIDHREPDVARRIHALLDLAHAQEARGLGRAGRAGAAPSAQDIQSSIAFYLGAFDGDRFVGAASLAPDDEPGQIGIALLCVAASHQRQGIGRSLVVEALRRGETMAFSVSAAADNAAALALYRGLGFVAYRRGTLGPDRLAMLKLRRAAAPTAGEVDDT
jgi:ribosomal protein S18 acetylase RimI-like enzyme